VSSAASSSQPAPVLSADFADASAINLALSELPAADRLRWAFQHFGARAAIGTSFQPAGVATLHLAQANQLPIKAFTLDTGLLFPETLQLKADLEARLGIHVESLRPMHSLEEQGRIFGVELWQRDPDLCCQMRKVLPLHERLFFTDCWITGLRRDQSRARATAPIVEVFTIPNTERRLWKLNALADWSRDDVWGYLKENQLPYNPLHDRGYRSIGCSTCTRATLEGEDERAGRWSGSAKVECGIHTHGSGI
jgi:phosphoadenosine phosphosulfate reductase